jgi:hypothetical protein
MWFSVCLLVYSFIYMKMRRVVIKRQWHSYLLLKSEYPPLLGCIAPCYQLTTGIVHADPERLVGLDVCSWVAVLQGAPEPIHQNCMSVAISTPLPVRRKRRNTHGYCAVSCTHNLLQGKNIRVQFSFWIPSLFAESLVISFTVCKMLIYQKRRMCVWSGWINWKICGWVDSVCGGSVVFGGWIDGQMDGWTDIFNQVALFGWSYIDGFESSLYETNLLGYKYSLT